MPMPKAVVAVIRLKEADRAVGMAGVVVGGGEDRSGGGEEIRLDFQTNIRVEASVVCR